MIKLTVFKLNYNFSKKIIGHNFDIKIIKKKKKIIINK